MSEVARAELVPARPDVWPFRDVPLTPDPMQAFAAVFAGVRPDLGDEVQVAIDLLPMGRTQMARRRRKLARSRDDGGDTRARGGGMSWGQALSGTGSGGSGMSWGQALSGGALNRPGTTRPDRSRPKVGALERLEQRDRDRSLASTLKDQTAHFQVQVLMRARSDIAGRPPMLIRSLIACFETWAGDNWWRVDGTKLGPWFIGSDVWWRRRDFDRRMDDLRWSGGTPTVVSAATLAGLLVPPTTHCPSPNVVRSGGVVPPAPRTLTEFTGQAGLMPWGEVSYDDESRIVGARLADTYFTATHGRSRFGKSETALVRFTHLARAGHGCLFLDPHADALTRVKPYLADQAHRIIELSIARGTGGGRQVGWNPFATAGQARDDMEDQAAAIVDSIAAAMKWGAINNRALSITQMATQSLLELSRQLPADTAPTIFQLATMLSDEDWRNEVLPALSPSLQSYWANRFPKLGGEAFTPITNVVDRLRQSPSIAALLGQSQSTYSLRDAMDNRQIVLVRLRGTSQIDQLIASFVTYDLLRATLSRWDLDPARRWPMHVFLDEVQSYDSAAGGLLASALEEGGKFGLRMHLLNQQPTRLASDTLAAVLTNRSHLASTNVGYDSARLLSREWGGDVTPETIMQLDKYEFIGQLTDRGHLTTPFRMRGLSLDATYDDPATGAQVDELEAAIDHNSGRRPISEVLDELATLDDRIVEQLRTPSSVVPIDQPRRPAQDRGPYREDRVRTNYTYGDDQ